jgi:hypothetical protein
MCTHACKNSYGWHILTSVGCAAPGATSPDNTDEELAKGSSSPTSVIKSGDTSENGTATGNEAAATSVASHWDVEDVGMMLELYINNAREDLEKSGAPLHIQGVVPGSPARGDRAVHSTYPAQVFRPQVLTLVDTP